ncbi:capsule biosynthesis GfcC family protein [Bacillus sp. NP157]|nr:capsule biosynthesis GfcC family protein [Bacillus sp. NP157]
MRAFLSVLVTTLLLNGAPHAADARLRVRVEGQVSHAGEFEFPASARYADAGNAGAPTPDAYPMGASLIRVDQVERQVRLKAGIVNSLSLVAADAGKAGNDRVIDATMHVLALVKGLPVTGRVAGAYLDPRAAEITHARNLHLADGDSLHFPVRPGTVRIVGAVPASCETAFIPLQDARRYLRGCTADRAADDETYFVIEPDGTVFKQGRALWNRSEPLALAPGAIVYVPVKASATMQVDPELDQDIAAFLATQVLP